MSSKLVYLFIAFVLLSSCQINNKSKNQQTSNSNSDGFDPWLYKDSILNVITPPNFPNNTFLITDFGAIAETQFDCTKAINDAIITCNESGGGKVIIPKGTWLTGPVILKSNVNLHLNEGSTLLFTTEKEKYLPVVHTRFEGMECMNYSPMIYAYQCENIAITGKGSINGQGQVWWNWKGNWEGSVKIENNKELRKNQLADVDLLTNMVEDNVPLKERVFGEGHYLRSNFIQPYECKNVLIEDITILESPMWIIHPVLCENVTVRGVKIESLGPNNDGCNPECCTNVLIDSCSFNTGDDCIAIKSGRNRDGRRIGIPSKNIIIQNCQMLEGHGGVVMGSEISGNVSHVFAENCVMDSPNLERAIRIKSNTMRGGIVEHVYIRNIEVKQVREAVLKINLLYAIYSQNTGKNIPIVRDIYLDNVNSQKSKYGYWIKGIEGTPVNNINITNSNFNNVEEAYFAENVENVTLTNFKINGEEIH